MMSDDELQLRFGGMEVRFNPPFGSFDRKILVICPLPEGAIVFLACGHVILLSGQGSPLALIGGHVSCALCRIAAN
jgi:hypothetical protein